MFFPALLSVFSVCTKFEVKGEACFSELFGTEEVIYTMRLELVTI